MPPSAQLAGRSPAAFRARWVLLGLTTLLLVTNAVKPLHMDDPFTVRIAEQIVRSPGDPYGFDIFWLQWPQPVHEELTPPVLPYWLAAGVGLFGERPWLWKLWLLPFAAGLCWGFFALARRFAPSVALPLTAATVASPALLPGFNLMQDVPAVALGLGGLAVFLDADERGSIGRAALAGLLLGLATQTKYTAVGALGAVVLFAALGRRRRPAAVTVGVALALFLGWEALMTAAYGRGMLFGQLRYGLFWYARTAMVLPLLCLVGATAPLLGAWGAAAAGAGASAVRLAATGVVAAFAGLAFAAYQEALFVALGVAGAVALVAALIALWRDRSGPEAPRVALFLAGWLAIEVGVYFATSPFPAVRRVLGVVVVATLVLGAAVSRRIERSRTPVPAWGVAAAGVVLGLLFQGADLLEARAQATAARAAAAEVRAADPDAKIWFVGHWGFQYYAERAGMQAIVPDASRLSAGDYVIAPLGVHRQEIRLTSADVEPVRRLEARDPFPLTTGHGYYGAATAIAHLAGPRLVTEILEVRRDVVPPTSWSARQLADWALRAGGRTAAAATPALIRTLSTADVEGRQFAAQGLGAIGARAASAVPELTRALDDRAPGVRHWAADALGRIGGAAASAEPRLRALTADPDPRVVEAATRALERIAGE